MSEIDYQFWNLILNAFTAIGTVGAVTISLYLTVWPKQKFKIHGVDVDVIYTGRTNNRPELDESNITFDIENKCDVQLHIFDVHIGYIFKEGVKLENNIPHGLILSFNKTFIPAKSRYHAKTKIPIRDLPHGTMDKVKTIKLRLGTSFGEKTLDLPQEWMSNYTRAIEKPAEKPIKEAA